ncbi:9105_t:CDS:2 [Dentiscutata erythropus]|uniref:9105_t:CDS:1 n=1 Tax=Dentiscutata erythropus TaxID=1348616 RepID=A0A9N9BNK4_9GLOM|nr:9105_t:CDS:2 [Dentiscutata erythropus]
MHKKRADSTCPQILTPLSVDSKTIVGYFPGYLTAYTHYGSDINSVSPNLIPWNITHLNWIAFGPDDFQNKDIPLTSTHVFLNRTIFLAIVLSGNIKIGSFANGTTSDHAGFITNVTNFVDLEYPNRFNCRNWLNDKNFVPLVNELSTALKGINKELSITVGPIPITGLNPDSVSFVNVMATQVNIIHNLTTSTNKTGPSITLDQTSTIMSNWSKIVPSAKLNLGVDLYGVIELTAPVGLGSLNNSQTIPRNLTNAPFTPSYSSDPPIQLFYDKCSFTLVNSIQLYPWYFMRQQTGPLINTCTAGIGWTRKFDSETSTTYLYKVSSATPVYEYVYVSYEDPQSIQYKLKLITNSSYGGIAISDLYADSSNEEMLNAITSVFPISYRNVTVPYVPYNYGGASSSIILAILSCIIGVSIAIFIVRVWIWFIGKD